jgi:zinc protease
MKRVASIVVVGLVAACAALSAQAPALPTVDQVLDKYLVAMGGQAAFDKITSRTAKATIEIPDMGITGTMTMTEKAPNKALVVVEIAQMTVREGTDGTVAWDENPQTGLRDKTGLELAEYKRGSLFNIETKLKTAYPKMNVTCRDTVNGRPAIVIDAIPEQGSLVKIFFDSETGLILKQAGSRETPEGPITFESFYDDYRTVDGIKQPHTLRQVTSRFTSVIRITEMKHNVPVDDALFRKPGL